MKRIYWRAFWVLAGFVFSFLAAATAHPALLGINDIQKMKPNGEYIVYVWHAGSWQKAGSLAFDRFFRERTRDLTKDCGFRTADCSNGKDNIVRIRLEQKGGGAAHIDSVFLGDTAPVEVKDIETGLKKLSKKDYDVIDAFGKTIELAFPANDAGHVLHLTARVEAREISKIPFQFPQENLYKEMNADSRFYSYGLRENVDTAFHSELPTPNSELLFKEYSSTGSGHPSGFTYGWVWNDAENLYVKIDFTADNTMDGDKDYAKVYVKTGEGLKEFKVSVPEQRWGRPLFTYSDTVSYQHKMYEFSIPFTQIGVNPLIPPFDKGEGRGFKEKELQLAFAAYGTASPGNHLPAVAYDGKNNRYLLAYLKVNASFEYDIYGQLINHDGTAIGTAFVISNAANTQYAPSIAYDSVNQRFLIAWDDFRSGANYDIYGQLVNADGTLYGGNFAISDAANGQSLTSVAYDSINQRFLVAWGDFRSGANYDIYGQLVNADGTLYGTASSGNFVISSAANDQNMPSVAYDSAHQRFLAVWADYRNDPNNGDIYAQLVNANGTLYDQNGSGTGDTNDNFAVYSGMYHQYMPSVAYDNINRRFLVVLGAWGLSGFTTSNTDIFAQLVNADGTLNGSIFAVSNGSGHEYYPAIDFDSAHQRFLAVWGDFRNQPTTSEDIYAQLVNADGTLYDQNGSGTGDTNDNFAISNAANFQSDPSLAYNALCSNFIVAYGTSETGVTDIGINLVGAACETTPPTVSSTSPASNAAGVAVNASIAATFSEAMSASTIASATFTLKDSANNAVAGAVSYDAATKTATLTPSANLAYTTAYTATITTGVKDLIGNAMAANYVWSFTTAAAPATNNAPSAPALVSPADGRTGMGTTVEFRWKKASDPDGDAVTYRLSYCTDQSFTGCSPVDVALAPRSRGQVPGIRGQGPGSSSSMVYYAGFGWIGMLLIGVVFAGGIAGRKKMALLLIVVLMATGVMLASCGGGGGGGIPADEMSYTVSGLNSGATYYWKVVADDGMGGTAESEVWSFTTQ